MGSISVIVFRLISLIARYRKHKIAGKIRYDLWRSPNEQNPTIRDMDNLLDNHFGTKSNGIDKIGNWYVLKQLGENVDGCYFTFFIQALMEEMKQREPHHLFENRNQEEMELVAQGNHCRVKVDENPA